eukprot:TRINITY_DN73353_c0_g1_i1.p1 TRINITY_DN73353_c0_g1~~TRINITY_DN73353_c0_g1_i1.p1  ORF type:complete len:122 (-),score=15.53 TRINITY_DN73353_c0_g1_i1:80-424(-)
MSEYWKEDILELITANIEKFIWRSTEISQFIKIELDKKFGCSWHVVTGEEFGTDITFEVGAMLYIYYGSLAILIWRCGTQLQREAVYNALNGDDEIARRNREMKRRKSIFQTNK